MSCSNRLNNSNVLLINGFDQLMNSINRLIKSLDRLAHGIDRLINVTYV